MVLDCFGDDDVVEPASSGGGEFEGNADADALVAAGTSVVDVSSSIPSALSKALCILSSKFCRGR